MLVHWPTPSVADDWLNNFMQTRYTEHPTYIDCNETLAQFCQQWSAAKVLALDTEFIRTDTFYPIGALLQVSDDKGCFLIDPLGIDDFQPFNALLTDSGIIKVLHSCSEDLEVFDRLLGVLPTPIFDTQIAAALDGLGFSLSYQRLTEAMLNIHVAKGETRSNWLQRPLTDSQIHYAALDVAYLPGIYQLLSDSLQEKGRLAWVEEECENLIANYRENNHPDQYYQRVKSAWKLSAEDLTLLQQLIIWRETAAREQDRPRGRIVKDKACLDIILKKPASMHELAAIDDIGPKTVRKYGEMILDMLDDSGHESEWLPRLPMPLPASTRNLAKALKSHVRHRAEQLGLAEEMLARKKDFEYIIRSGLNGDTYALPDNFLGWRKNIIGDELLDIASRA